MTRGLNIHMVVCACVQIFEDTAAHLIVCFDVLFSLFGEVCSFEETACWFRNNNNNNNNIWFGTFVSILRSSKSARVSARDDSIFLAVSTALCLRKRENTGSIRENTSNVGKFMRRCFT